MTTVAQTCDIVENTINHRIKGKTNAVRAIGAKVLPGMLEVSLQLAPSTRVNQIKALSNDIGLALGSARVRIAQTGIFVAVQVPTEGGEQVKLSRLLPVSGLPPYTVTLGIGEDGRPVHMVLAAPDVSHFLLAGTTGSGKTVMSNTLVTGLCCRHSPSELGIVYIDPKRRVESKFVRNISQHLLAPPIVEADDVWAVLDRVVEQMEKRVLGVDGNYPRVLVVIDELADVLMTGGIQVEELITRIAQRGREPGFHLLVSTQKPTAKSIGSLLKANLPARLCGRVMSVEDSRAATGIPGLDAHLLAGGGQFILACAGKVVRLQGAMCDVIVPNWNRPQHEETKTALFKPKQIAVPTAPMPASTLKHPYPFSVPKAAPVSPKPEVVANDIIGNDLVAKTVEYLRANPEATKYAVCKHVLQLDPSGQSRMQKAQNLIDRAKEAMTSVGNQ